MGYILVMTLAGSVLVLCYLIWKGLFPGQYYEKTAYLFLKLCVIFYLVPLVFLKELYRTLLAYLPSLWTGMARAADGLVYTRRDRATMVIGGGEAYYCNRILENRALVVGIWVGGALLFFGWQILRTGYYKRLFMAPPCSVDWEEQEQLPALCREYRIRRRVTLRRCCLERVSFTAGLFRPVIFCSGAGSPWETELLLRHELVHIRRWDMLWNFLTMIVLGLHWYNPLAWTEEEKNAYMRMLILWAKGKTRTPQILFAEKSKKKKAEIEMEKRLDHIMQIGNGKKPNITAAAAMIVCAVLADSLTALAYPDVQVVRISRDSEHYEEFVEGALEDEMVFIPDGTEDPFYIAPDLVLYDEQFVDEAGDIYPVEEIRSYASCNHTYVSGTYAKHELLSDGGCIYTTYRAQRCSKCGNVVLGSVISSQTNHPCPHK